MTARKKPFSGRQVDLFSVAVGVAGNETDSKGVAGESPVANASMPLSLCGETGADATESVDDMGGARIVNFDASCWADAFFLGATIRRAMQNIKRTLVRHSTAIDDIMSEHAISMNVSMKRALDAIDA